MFLCSNVRDPGKAPWRALRHSELRAWASDVHSVASLVAQLLSVRAPPSSGTYTPLQSRILLLPFLFLLSPQSDPSQRQVSALSSPLVLLCPRLDSDTGLCSRHTHHSATFALFLCTHARSCRYGPSSTYCTFAVLDVLHQARNELSSLSTLYIKHTMTGDASLPRILKFDLEDHPFTAQNPLRPVPYDRPLARASRAAHVSSCLGASLPVLPASVAGNGPRPPPLCHPCCKTQEWAIVALPRIAARFAALQASGMGNRLPALPLPRCRVAASEFGNGQVPADLRSAASHPCNFRAWETLLPRRGSHVPQITSTVVWESHVSAAAVGPPFCNPRRGGHPTSHEGQRHRCLPIIQSFWRRS